MPFIPLDNAVRCVCTGLGPDSQEFVHVLYFDTVNPAGWSAFQRNKLGELVRDNLLADLSVVLSNFWQYTSVVVTTMETEPQSQTIVTSGFPMTGELTSGTMPANVAFCVAHRTNNIGRSYRGRTYHPGLVEADVVANTLSQTRADSIVDAWDQLRSALAADGDFRQIIASFVSGGAPRAVGVGTVVVSHDYTDRRVDTMRRRLP